MDLLRNKAFRKFYFGGVLISGLGTQIFNFVVAWYILDQTHSAFVSGLYLFINNLLRVLTMMFFAGPVADRVSRKKIMYTCDFAAAFILGCLLVSMRYLSIDPIPPIIAASSLISLLFAFLNTASNGLVSNIVPQEDLVKANGLLQGTAQVLAIVGTGLGGILYLMVPIETFIFVNMLSFLFSALLEVTLQVQEEYLSELSENPPRERLLDNLKLVFELPYMPQVLTTAMVLNGGFSLIFSNSMPYIINVVFHKNSVFLSIISITTTSMALIMTVLVTKKSKPITLDKTITTSINSILIGSLIILITTHIALLKDQFMIFYVGALIGTVFLILKTPELNINTSAFLMSEVDDDKRGRVFGVLGGCAQLLQPFALLLGGFGIEFFGVTSILALVFLLFLMAYFVNQHLAYHTTLNKEV